MHQLCLMYCPDGAHTAARVVSGSTGCTTGVRAARSASRALGSDGRARRERLPRPGAGDAARPAAEPGLLPPAVAPRRRARHRHPQLRRSAGQLLPPRSRSLRPCAGRQRHGAPSGAAAESPAVRPCLSAGEGPAAVRPVRLHRQQRPLAGGRSPSRAPLGRRGPGDERGEPTQGAPAPRRRPRAARPLRRRRVRPATPAPGRRRRRVVRSRRSPCATRRARSARTSPAPPDGCTGASRTPRRPTPRATRPSSAPRTRSTRASGTCFPSSPRHRHREGEP